MDGLWQEILAVSVFLFSHSLTNRPALRRWAIQRLGHSRRFTLGYSVLSLFLLAWIIVTVREAPVLVVWTQMPWMRWVPPLIMLPVCLLAVMGLLAPNPFSIGPGPDGYDPDHPGILRLTRHPVLWALSLWAAAHTIANGTVAALILFVPMLLLSLIGPVLLDRRRQRQWGAAEWRHQTALTQRIHPALWREIGWRPWLGGLLLYGGLIALHPWIIGRWPLP